MKDTLSKQLRGFRKNRIHCLIIQHGLISTLDMWKKDILDQGGYTCAISMDLSKAFDTLNHDLLIVKLRAYGFEAESLRYMKRFLVNRE